jgi:hypothetical protein
MEATTTGRTTNLNGVHQHSNEGNIDIGKSQIIYRKGSACADRSQLRLTQVSVSISMQKVKTEMIMASEICIADMRTVPSSQNTHWQRSLRQPVPRIEYPYYMLRRVIDLVFAASFNRILSVLLNAAVGTYFFVLSTDKILNVSRNLPQT